MGEVKNEIISPVFDAAINLSNFRIEVSKNQIGLDFSNFGQNSFINKETYAELMKEVKSLFSL